MSPTVSGRVFGVHISDSAGIVDLDQDLALAEPDGTGGYRAAFYLADGRGGFVRIGDVFKFDGGEPPSLTNKGAIGPCLAGQATKGAGEILHCAQDGRVTTYSRTE